MNQFLARDEVRQAMLGQGVTSEAALARVAAMSDSEVAQLAGRIDQAPAGGEVLGLLRKGLDGAPKTTHVQEIQGEFNAIDTALGRLNAGDLCLILIDQVEEALGHIAQRVAEANAKQ